MTKFLTYVGVVIAAVLLGVLAATVIINSITNRPKANVDTAVVVVVTTPATTTTILDELAPPVTVTASDPGLTPMGTLFVENTRRNYHGWIESMTDVQLVVYARGVCADFDQKLWFWDMYETRLTELTASGWTSDTDAAALQIVMAGSVNNLCAYNRDRLPSELLGH